MKKITFCEIFLKNDDRLNKQKLAKMGDVQEISSNLFKAMARPFFLVEVQDILPSVPLPLSVKISHCT